MQTTSGKEHMRSLTTVFVLLVGLWSTASLARAQGTESASKVDASATVSATREEVNQLRRELAAQRQTIEELKALVETLAETTRAANSSTQIRPASDASSAVT